MPRKRQCTYAMRRVRLQVCVDSEEYSNALLVPKSYLQKKLRELRVEARKLEFQLEMVKTQLSSSVVATADKDTRKVTGKYAELLAIGRNNQLQIAKGYSAISGCMGDYNSYPLHTRIHRGKNWDQRRATLLSIKEEKLHAAFDFVMDHSRLLDHDKSSYSDEIFETAEGDWCCVRFETIQFPGVESLEQVFDAVMRYFRNTELFISEKPGNFALRDDYECLEGGINNSRIIATNSTGTTLEASTLVISRLLENGDDRFGGEPIGIVAIDSVDEDKLFPWVPSERVRQDGAGAIVLTRTTTCANESGYDQNDESSSSGSSTSGEECLTTITLRRADYIKLYRPQFSLSAEAEQDLHDGFTRTGEFMRKEIRRIVYGQA